MQILVHLLKFETERTIYNYKIRICNRDARVSYIMVAELEDKDPNAY